MTHSETAKEQRLIKISLTKPSLLSSYHGDGTGASGDVRGSEWLKAGVTGAEEIREPGDQRVGGPLSLRSGGRGR